MPFIDIEDTDGPAYVVDQIIHPFTVVKVTSKLLIQMSQDTRVYTVILFSV